MDAANKSEAYNTRKDYAVLHDLLVIIKSITTGQALVSLKTIENTLECNIDVPSYLPSVRVLYKNCITNQNEIYFNFINSVHYDNIVKTLVEKGSKYFMKPMKTIEDVLHDLFVLIEAIIAERAFISSLIIENVFLINVSNCQFCVILSYDNHTESYRSSNSVLNKANHNMFLENISSTGSVNNAKLFDKAEVFVGIQMETNISKEFSKNENKEEFLDKHNGWMVLTETQVPSFHVPHYLNLLNHTIESPSHTSNKHQPLTACNYNPIEFSLSKDGQVLNSNIQEKIHPTERAPVFVYCEKTFISKSNKQMNKGNHSVRKLYACSYCNKTFASNFSKCNHERSHTGERPYACTFCDKTFRDHSVKHRHERIHTGERPYACSYCGKTFPYFSSRSTHEKIHTGDRPYACSYCEKTFLTLAHKRSHERNHTGEKPYACYYCDKTFNQSSNLQRHQLIHSNDE